MLKGTEKTHLRRGVCSKGGNPPRKLSKLFLEPMERISIVRNNKDTRGNINTWLPSFVVLRGRGTPLQDFNDTVTHPLGYIEVTITLGEGHNIITIDSPFLTIPCKSVYKYILGRSFVATLNAIASSVHLKLKYHNVQQVLVTICTDLFGGENDL